MEETRGTLFWNIARILADERARPRWCCSRTSATWRARGTRRRSRRSSRRCVNWATAPPAGPLCSRPTCCPATSAAVRRSASASSSWPTTSGPRPRRTPRTSTTRSSRPRPSRAEWRKEDWDLERDLPLQPDDEVDRKYFLESAEQKWIDTWDRLLTEVAERLEPGERLPGFPIWADDWRSLDEASDMIDVAAQSLSPFPAWKKSFLLKNAEFYERHAEVLDRYRSSSTPSRPRGASSSGRRASTVRWRTRSCTSARRGSVPSAPTTCLPSSPSPRPRCSAVDRGRPGRCDARRSPRRDRAPAGAPGLVRVHAVGRPRSGPTGRQQKDAASYKQMGNGVNVGAAYHVFTRVRAEHARRDRGSTRRHVVAAVDRGGPFSGRSDYKRLDRVQLRTIAV